MRRVSILQTKESFWHCGGEDTDVLQKLPADFLADGSGEGEGEGGVGSEAGQAARRQAGGEVGRRRRGGVFAVEVEGDGKRGRYGD